MIRINYWDYGHNHIIDIILLFSKSFWEHNYDKPASYRYGAIWKIL